MGRIRTIKPEFWVDDQIVELPYEARLLFIGLWNFVDDEGLIEFKPKRIKMQVFPSDKVDVQKQLDSLISTGRLTVLDSDQGPLLWVTNWSRHQIVNRPTPTKFTGLPAPFSVSPHGALSESSVLKGKEGKGREGISGEPKPIPSDWVPTDEHTKLARERRVDLMLEAARFRAHAEANDRKLVRWNAGFNQWLLKAEPAKVVPVDWMNR